MTDRPLPQPGEQWQHYKLKNGKEYIVEVIAIALLFKDPVIPPFAPYVIYSKSDLFTWSNYVRVFDTESDQVFWMSRNEAGNGYLLSPTTETWHQKDVTDQTLWGRPLAVFMDVVSSPNGEQSSNWYRLEKVESDRL